MNEFPVRLEMPRDAPTSPFTCAKHKSLEMLRYLRHSLPGNDVGQKKSTPFQRKTEGPRRVIHDPEDDEISPKMTTDLLKLRRCTNQATHLTNQNPENESRGKEKHRMCIYARLRPQSKQRPTTALNKRSRCFKVESRCFKRCQI